ncbi:MAG TPA: hypothetical protein VLX91_04080 [Candidatus Acidoferrales bacterium]|nr:hypothetical protein [Candidatus Acidoferrales bacterium]
MKRLLYFVSALLSMVGLFKSTVIAQMENLHGDDREYRIGMHSGNQFRTTFFNDGTWGGQTQNYPGMSIVKTDIPGEWPINSGHWYLIDGDTYVLSEVADNYDPINHRLLLAPGTVRHVESTVKAAPGGGTQGDKDPVTNAWWTFLPLPGFANPNDQLIAMAKGGQQWFDYTKGAGSWPRSWPDVADLKNPYKIYSSDGWAGSWNGYFGRDKFNADEESYFVADDYAKQKFPSFRPDTNDVTRGGLGIRMFVRGFQWSNTLVQDALFIVSDLENIGTYQHNKVVFGYKIGNNMGQTNSGPDAGDDGGSYDISNNLSWTWDNNGLGASDWGPTPVGISGACLLETPGDPFDGIDNDNDGNPNSPNYGMANHEVGAVQLATINGPQTFYAGSGPTITTDMFQPKVLGIDDKIVLIDYRDPHYKRTVTTFRQALADQGKGPADTLDITFGGFVYEFWAGDTLKEIGDNLFDDNLNGIIDENRGVADPSTGIINYLYVGHKYIDYANPDQTSNGSLNPLIDERRDDGVDNNGNWVNRDSYGLNDDTGQDGLGPGDPGYPGADKGEGDGLPTPGETHFDKTDINESDMVGLTSFNLYQWNTADKFGNGKQDDDQGWWNRLAPGSFYAYDQASNVELAFGAGYFPLPPGDIERISYSFIVVAGPSGGWTGGAGPATPPDNLLQEKDFVQLAYDQNYNFSKPPDIPVITSVVTGNHKVTLFWDTRAERSKDPISGHDFEGYKIYRSTYPDWSDMAPITDAQGNVIMRKPSAQFDIDESQTPGLVDSTNTTDYKGYAAVPYALQGIYFWLGNDTGLRHYFIDTTAVNGMTYYYAVTSYDHGDAAHDIAPAECSKYVALNPDGTYDHGTNVIRVVPNSPAAGYVPADLDTSKFRAGLNNTADGALSYKIVDGTKVKENHTYRITFGDKDTLYQPTSTQQGEYYQAATLKTTGTFTLVDTTSGDTVISNSPLFAANNDELALVNHDGFSLSFQNDPAMLYLDFSPAAKAGWARRAPEDSIDAEPLPYYIFVPYRSGDTKHMPTDLIPTNSYEIDFGEVGVDTSKPFKNYVLPNIYQKVPAIPVDFTIKDTKTGEKVDFAFLESDTMQGGPGVFSFSKVKTGASASDVIIFLNQTDTIPGWALKFNVDTTAKTSGYPQPGDRLILPMTHPFLSNDSYTFTTKAETVDSTKAKAEMGKIRVVPNPYIVTNSWEPHNVYSNGRGTRELHFTHLPQKCTIDIFDVRGQLIKTIHHNAPMDDGTEVWNMLSKDNLEIAYGIYIYYIDAPGVGRKIDKFVVIK